ncbi:MAG: hypothetical protein AAGF24_03220 [Cyanobacteria bacterium P01_H01_bin.121]
MSSAQMQAGRTMNYPVTGKVEPYIAITWTGEIANAGVGGEGQYIIGFTSRSGEDEVINLIRGETSLAIAGVPLDGTEQRLKTDANGHLIPWAAPGDKVAALLKKGVTADAAGHRIEVLPVTGAA